MFASIKSRGSRDMIEEHMSGKSSKNIFLLEYYLLRTDVSRDQRETRHVDKSYFSLVAVAVAS